MGGQFPNILAVESFYSKKIEEILHTKEMEIASLELQLSKLKNFQLAGSHNKHISHDGSRLLTEISYDFTHGHTEKEGTRRRERKMHQSVLKGKKLLTYSSSDELVKKLAVNCSSSKVFSDSPKGKKALQPCVARQLDERLKILEEENEVIKKAFFETEEERKKLVNDIYQQFQTIFKDEGRRLDGA